MAGKQVPKCMRGLHELSGSNIRLNSEGFRECKACSSKRRTIYKRERSNAAKWLRLIIAIGESRAYGSLLEREDGRRIPAA